ncbi:MAG: hypothetical protein M5U25_11370 [Planctomycetota bacterium]|nr:hypothetical protein [Planctomycetota bacterium]
MHDFVERVFDCPISLSVLSAWCSRAIASRQHALGVFDKSLADERGRYVYVGFQFLPRCGRRLLPGFAGGQRACSARSLWRRCPDRDSLPRVILPICFLIPIKASLWNETTLLACLCNSSEPGAGGREPWAALLACALSVVVRLGVRCIEQFEQVGEFARDLV